MHPKRIAVVDAELCNPQKCAGECVSYCPVNRNGSECIKIVKDAEPGISVISEELCTGCGICIKVCPFHAIDIVNLVAPVEEKLVFSYGENSFDLYGLALPKAGIVGIVGENGCGKSTNVKLLTGALSPKRMYSKEVKEYFEHAHSSTVAVKPQELAGRVRGKVKGMLAKVDEAGRLPSLSEALDLDGLMGREFAQLSGGELQRVAVAAVLCRNRDAYILDEPFAFLDYAYRIRLVQWMRANMADRSVLVVDHDLSLLSYLCDYSYIMFGVPGAYGIVSQPYATDRAINMFLDGYIEPENVRFRDGLKYKEYAPEKRPPYKLSIPPIEASRGTFTIVNPVAIPLLEGEVIGIAGPNGTGKSTLLGELAKIHSGASSKPQILERSRELVMSFMRLDSPFKESYVRQMGLARLEYLSLRQLSGGELQKAEVFRCLAAAAPLYLLDEPTNMMDVPGRIALSKLLREKAVADGAPVVVVDHDLEFLLNTVDRLIVFGGQPGISGTVLGAFPKAEGVAKLLSRFELSYRRDAESNRLKLNKQGSVKDRELKDAGKFVE